MQTAVMGTENRSGLRFVFNLRIKISLKAVRFFCLFVIREGLAVKGRKKPKKLTAKTISDVRVVCFPKQLF